ncbi:MAG TPA: 50S ribosomal protein L4 [Candidatus Methylacidiphilales bacterium]|jgi:large subunit ribosomal protein L4|nr:50S ribosomal protein L4 [Candidatus Methylacidiphilales bacterium]
MSFSPLSTKDAASKLKVDLIENGIGTQALHETVVAMRANRRAGTHSTKTKATVAGSGKKPWRQKGTGNARSGYKSSPVWSGGGVVFGPHPRDYSKKTNKSVKQLALKKAISSRVNAGEVYLIDPITLSKPKTKDLVAKLGDNIDKKTTALLVIENLDQNIYLASRNHPHLIATTGDLVNAEQVLLCDKIFITDGALGKISARLQK